MNKVNIGLYWFLHWLIWWSVYKLSTLLFGWKLNLELVCIILSCIVSENITALSLHLEFFKNIGNTKPLLSSFSFYNGRICIIIMILIEKINWHLNICSLRDHTVKKRRFHHSTLLLQCSQSKEYAICIHYPCLIDLERHILNNSTHKPYSHHFESMFILFYAVWRHVA